MARTSGLAGPKTARAMPMLTPGDEPRLSRIILAGTGVIGFTIVLLWLILEAWIPARPVANVRHFELGHVEGVSPPDGAADSVDRAIGGIEQFLREVGDEPAIVVLHGVGASRANGEPLPGGCLLAPGRSPDAAPVPIPMERIVQLLRGREGRARTLLILDCEVEAVNRDLGFVGNDFIGQLGQLLPDGPDKDGNVSVLAACAEGQMSWAIEGRGRTAFGHYVGEFLDGQVSSTGRFDVQELYDYVRPRVARWAARHRSGAIQTPKLFGNGRLVFRARRRLDHGPAKPVVASTESQAKESGSPEASRTPEQELADEWANWGRMAKREPHPRRYAPIAWRLYQDALLRAERRLRAGDGESARALLVEARRRRAEAVQASGPELPPPWSLALLERATDGRDRSALAKEHRLKMERLLPAEPGAAAEVGGQRAGAPDDPAARPGPAKGPPGNPAKAREVGPAAGPRPDPLAVLAPDGGPSRPMTEYVEAEVPVWYAEFRRRGGESPGMRTTRIGLIRRAIAVRTTAERVAALDVQAALWGAPLIEEGDRSRRDAQDHLFAGTTAAIQPCAEGLERAQRSYDRARIETQACAEAFDLLREVQDTLPCYGDWVARSGRKQRLQEEGWLEQIAERARELADLAYDGPGTAPGRDGKRKRLLEAARQLREAFSPLKKDFDGQVAAAGTTASWRDIDSLLRVPAIDPEKRRALCAHARDPSPSEGPEEIAPILSSSHQAEPDPGFSALALASARLELQLLRLVGHDDRLFELAMERAEQALRSRPEIAADHFEEMSSLILAGRAQIDKARAHADEPGNSRLADRRPLAIADRAARILPGCWLRGSFRDFDPAPELDELDAQQFIVWSAKRLLDDFNISTAKRLLDFLEPSQPPGWVEARRLANDREHARLKVTVPTQPVGVTAGRVVVASLGNSWPKGRAVVFLASAGAPATESSTPWSDLVDVPAPPTTSLEFGPSDVGAEIKVTPCAFFRGRFEEDRPISLVYTEWVKVVIRQAEKGEKFWRLNGKRVRYRIDDQFLEHPHVGYFHTGKNLKYRVEIINQSDQPLKALVTADQGGKRVISETLQLEPGRPGQPIMREMIGQFLKPDKPETLLIRVHEGDERGRSLCKPFEVAFVPSDPKEYVVPRVRWEGPAVRVTLDHLARDPVPFPADVNFWLEPVDHFRDVGQPPRWIPRQGFVTFRSEMIKPTEELKYHLEVNGVEKETKTIRLNEKAAKTKEEPGEAPKGAPDAGIR